MKKHERGFWCQTSTVTQYKDNYWREITEQNLSRLLQMNEPAWEPGAAIEALDVKEETKEILRNRF